jgi:hypothetical protein
MGELANFKPGEWVNLTFERVENGLIFQIIERY